MIRTKGEAGTGDIVEAVRHLRALRREMRRARRARPGGARRGEAKRLAAADRARDVRGARRAAAGAELRGGGHRDASRRGALHGARRRGGLRRQRRLSLARIRAARARDRDGDDLLARTRRSSPKSARGSARRCAALEVGKLATPSASRRGARERADRRARGAGRVRSPQRALEALGHRAREVRCARRLRGAVRARPAWRGERRAARARRGGSASRARSRRSSRAAAPVLATCAGPHPRGAPRVLARAASFGFLDVTVARNAYGRQVHSFEDREMTGDRSSSSSSARRASSRSARARRCSRPRRRTRAGSGPPRRPRLVSPGTHRRSRDSPACVRRRERRARSRGVIRGQSVSSRGPEARRSAKHDAAQRSNLVSESACART